MPPEKASDVEVDTQAFKWAALIIAVITILITIVFFSWWAMKEYFVFGHDAFDQVRWIAPANANTPACDRGDMVLDIQRNLLKPGMSKKEVTVLLGRPAWEEPDQIEYELGMCLWAVHGLRLFFDSDGHLLHTDIVQH